MSSGRRPHIIRRQVCYLHVVCTTDGQHRPKLSLYCDRNWLLNGICDKNIDFFHLRIIEMICEIICVDGFPCISHLDIVHMLFVYLHIIHILSEHMRIIHTLFAVVLGMFLCNRQCQCHPYIISTTLYIFYHLQLGSHTLSTQTYIHNAI